MTEKEILELLNENRDFIKQKNDSDRELFKAQGELKEQERERNGMGLEIHIENTLGADAAFSLKDLKPIEQPFLRFVFLGGAILLAVLWIVFSFVAPIPFLSTLCIFGAIACGILYYTKNKEFNDYTRWVACKKQYGEDVAKQTASFHILVAEKDAEIQALKEKIEELKLVPQQINDALRKKGFAELLHESWWHYWYIDQLCEYLSAGLTWEESFGKVKEQAEINAQCQSCIYYKDCRKTQTKNCASYVPKSV